MLPVFLGRSWICGGLTSSLISCLGLGNNCRGRGPFPSGNELFPQHPLPPRPRHPASRPVKETLAYSPEPGIWMLSLLPSIVTTEQDGTQNKSSHKKREGRCLPAILPAQHIKVVRSSLSLPACGSALGRESLAFSGTAGGY